MALENNMSRSNPLCSAICLLALLGQNASASNTCRTDAGRFVSIQGVVEVQPATGGRWESTTLEYRLCQGDSIRVGVQSRAAIALVNDAVLRLDENTTMHLVNVNPQDEERSFLDLVRGGIMSFSRKPKRLEVSTPYLNGSIEGTEFAFLVGEGESQLTVFEGTVIAANSMGALPVSGGQTAVAAEGEAPQPRILVRPRDAVQWSLYYPPILAAGGTESSELREASALLAVGRVDAALASVDQAITQQTDAGLAYALRSVIRVTQNEVAAALADAERAVSLTDAAAARIALSYAQQANFQIESARNTLLTTVEQHPEDALAWARLAELWLMQGNRREARVAAERAVELQPDLGRTQSILGFAALAELRVQPAQEAFSKAIALDSADPMPHLGLGLAKIRSSQLAQGRADIEAAVALDSNSALLRAYLGRAYFEEKRGPLDAEQFEIAKELDPNDPTAFFYDAIQKQTTNRPVEALADMQQAIELNDNRAVYRSRSLLDSDQAARGASLAGIYSDLGFQQLGLVEGWKSVNTDPSSSAAHRFLSDAYSVLPRHEIARVSELLQSQLLDPLSATPIQPLLAESNLFLISSMGPAAVGFNEFNRLFTRDGVTFQVSGLAGSNDTQAGEAIVSGISDKTAFSIGAFHYDTDGFRDNADQKDTVANVFLQHALSPDTSVQAEYRYRKTEYGDLLMRFSPDEYYPGQRNEVERHSFRVGGRHDLSVDSTLLASLAYQNADTSLTDREFPNPFFGAPDDPFFPLNQLDALGLFADLPEDAYSAEVQHLYRSPRLKLTSGAGYFHVDGTLDLNVEADLAPVFGLPDPFIVPLAAEEIPTDVRHGNFYSYAHLQPLDSVSVTLGGSVDRVYGDFPGEDTTKFNPKLGAIWDLTQATAIRAAYFTTLKRTLVTNQTLEPTQVAGFNQFYDDPNLTEAKRYGVALDHKFSRTLYGGLELSKRDLDVPFFDQNNIQDTADWDERIGRAYLFWTPTSQLALTLQYSDEKYTRDESFPEGLVDLETKRVDLGASYFHPKGLGGMLKVSHIDQDGDFRGIYTSGRGSDRFWVADAAVSYRLPARRGMVSAGVSNLFDEKFNYFDVDLNNSSIQPTRMLFVRLTLDLR